MCVGAHNYVCARARVCVCVVVVAEAVVVVEGIAWLHVRNSSGTARARTSVRVAGLKPSC